MKHLKGTFVRPVEKNDLDLILEWRNSDRVRDYMFTDAIITPLQHLCWYEDLHQYNLALMFVMNEKPAGVVCFRDFDIHRHSCSWGFYLGEADLPAGSGSLMSTLALNLLFDQYPVQKVCGQALTRNHRSISLHLKLGFRVEGCLREHIKKGPAGEDIILFSLFRSDWRPGITHNDQHTVSDSTINYKG